MTTFLKKKMALIVLFVLNVVPVLAYAMLWPVVLPPNERLLLNRGDIDRDHCPRNQGKLGADIKINIRESLCVTYCPESWTWEGSSDGACLDLSKDFTLQGYDIKHYKDDNDDTLYSVVTAFYGEKDSAQHAFQFVFTTPKEHWFCYAEENELHTVMCGNDI